MNESKTLTTEQQRIIDLLKNKEFLKDVISQDSVGDVQKIFENKGLKLTEEEVNFLGDIINEALNRMSNLSEKELEEIGRKKTEEALNTYELQNSLKRQIWKRLNLWRKN